MYQIDPAGLDLVHARNLLGLARLARSSFAYFNTGLKIFLMEDIGHVLQFATGDSTSCYTFIFSQSIR